MSASGIETSGIGEEDRHRRGPKPLEKRVGHSLIVIRLIAVFKFIKATLLLIVGSMLMHMLNLDRPLHDVLRSVVNDLRLDENNYYIQAILDKTLGASAGKLRLISAGTIVYSGLYFVEGVGLWFDKGWAEVLTVITTAGFLPLEMMEILKGPTAVRLALFGINIALLVYILLRLRWRHLAKKSGVDLKALPPRMVVKN